MKASVKPRFAPGDVVVYISSPSIKYVIKYSIMAPFGSSDANWYALRLVKKTEKFSGEDQLELAYIVDSPLWKALL